MLRKAALPESANFRKGKMTTCAAVVVVVVVAAVVVEVVVVVVVVVISTITIQLLCISLTSIGSRGWAPRSAALLDQAASCRGTFGDGPDRTLYYTILYYTILYYSIVLV